MKAKPVSIKLYKTSVEGDPVQSECKADLIVGSLSGDEFERIAGLMQGQLGICYAAAKHLVSSIFTSKPGTG
jgi:hypothetical protein